MLCMYLNSSSFPVSPIVYGIFLNMHTCAFLEKVTFQNTCTCMSDPWE